jgi:hypothetical protein
VKDADKNIDAYQVKNIQSLSQKMDLQAKQIKNLQIYQTYPNFTHYRFNDADAYVFFIYSPKKIVSLDVNNFYDQKLDLKSKPIIFDQTKYNQINLIDENNWSVNSPTVSFKASTDNSNKYYVKLSKIDKNLPFLLVFNQMFSPNWRVYYITKAQWDAVNCDSKWQNYKITDNSRCEYSGIAFDPGDLNLIGRKYLEPENHFRGNIIGNVFLFLPKDINNRANDQDLYLVVYFQKQLYYIICLMISALAFIGLLIMSLIEIVRTKNIRVKEI